MNLKIVGISVCIMMLATITIVSGVNNNVEPQREIIGIFDKTIVRGIVLFPRISPEGETINFFALRLSYKTINFGGITSGVIKLKPVQMPTNFNGYLGKFYIFGSFRGCLDIQK